MTRPLNYEINHRIVKRTVSLPSGASRETEVPEMTFVSSRIGVDHKHRMWVVTINKQPVRKKDGSYERVPNMTALEIFDKDGLFLGELSFPERGGFMRLIGDRIYLIDTREEMCIYEYRIVEK